MSTTNRATSPRLSQLIQKLNFKAKAPIAPVANTTSGASTSRVPIGNKAISPRFHSKAPVASRASPSRLSPRLGFKSKSSVNNIRVGSRLSPRTAQIASSFSGFKAKSGKTIPSRLSPSRMSPRLGGFRTKSGEKPRISPKNSYKLQRLTVAPVNITPVSH